MLASRRSVTLPLLFLAAIAGCRVSSHKDGKNEDVNIGTPFGSMQVKTDEGSTASQIGLTPYPGATRVEGEKDNNGAANISMSFGGLHLGVRALDLHTPDKEDKVQAFYRKDMSRYGTVIACRGKEPAGGPTRTGEGLTCSTDRGGSSSNNLELRTGSAQHQHIVGIHPQDDGTRIGLVALDLPHSLHEHESGERE